MLLCEIGHRLIWHYRWIFGMHFLHCSALWGLLCFFQNLLVLFKIMASKLRTVKFTVSPRDRTVSGVGCSLYQSCSNWLIPYFWFCEKNHSCFFTGTTTFLHLFMLSTRIHILLDLTVGAFSWISSYMRLCTVIISCVPWKCGFHAVSQCL